MSKSIMNSVLYDAIPDSLRDDSNVVAIAYALDGEIQRMASAAINAQWSSNAVPTGIVDGSRVQQLTGEQLDHVAWSWGSVVWDRDWNEQKKRAYVVGILDRKKRLGTAECIRDAFSTIGVEVDVVDCMTDSSVTPGTFMLYTDEPVVMASQWRMLYIVDRIKPASRSYTWGHRITAEGASFAGAGFTMILRKTFDFIASQPVYEFTLNQYDTVGSVNGSVNYLDFEAIQPPEPQPQGMIVGGTLAVTSEGETTVLRETMFGTLSRSIGMVATNVTTGTIEAIQPPEPEGIIIGETTTVPEGTTVLFSDYYWSTGFENISSGNNLYSPSNWSNDYGSLPNDSGLVSVPGTEFDDVVIVGNDTTIEKIVVTNSELQFRLTTYNGKPEIYLNGSFESSAFVNGSNSGVAVKPASTCTSIAKMRYSLGYGASATGLYTISGTTITWNTEHPLYRLLQGKTAYTSRED